MSYWTKGKPSMGMSVIPLKVVVCGDGAVGKTSLLISYCTGTFPEVYIPTTFDNYAQYHFLDCTPVQVGLWDTSMGGEDYDRLRPLSYPQTDIFLLVFSVDDRYSFNNIKDKWVPEARHYMPDVPIILIGNKSDLRSPKDGTGFVAREEAENLVEELHLHSYREFSALTRDGLADSMDHAFRTALAYAEGNDSSKKGAFGKLFDKSKSNSKTQGTKEPFKPPREREPWPEVETSNFAEQWKNILEDPQHADVTFIVEGKHQLKSHKIILGSASSFFKGVFLPAESKRPNQLEPFIEKTRFTPEDLNSGQMPGVIRLFEETTEVNLMTFIELAPWISAKTFVRVLTFLYTGDPSLTASISDEELDLIMRVSHTFSLPQLEIICMNHKEKNYHLNQSIATFVNDETVSSMKEMFFNSSQLANISFKVGGEKVWAHKAVLSARCEVMAAMFSGHFAEGKSISEVELFDTSLETFLVFLEYLYTDHAPIDDHNCVDLLILADHYCLRRLVSLCELYISKMVRHSCEKTIQNAEIDVIGLLLTAQQHNAQQLSKWCLHFISTNYQAFTRQKDFNKLTGSNKEYVEEHQWPPLSYLNEMEASRNPKKSKKCTVS